jgi:RNA polymerase sigma-70 factor (ECF subfamily)
MTHHDHGERATDDALIQYVNRGCADCFALLFHRYFRQVFSLAFSILRDTAESEDILQEVFLAIYLRREQFDPERGTVRTWILQFAYFKALLRRRYLALRRAYKEQEEAEAREMRSRLMPEPLGLNPAERARCVESAMAALAPKQRRVIQLVHCDGHTLRECSEILGETLANTRNHYYRGLRTLRDYFKARSERKKTSEAVITEKIDVCPSQP